jgi:LCP family protein required for cell wall assembly
MRRLFVLVLVLLIVAAGLAVWADSTLERIDVAGLAPGSGPDTVLIVGSDSRENLPDDLEGSFGDFGGSRADVIILAHASGTRLQMLSLPRDLKVSLPGRGADKINAAYAYGGPDLLVETIESDLGIPIAGYLEVEFGGFASIVDAVGGVELTFEAPTRDLKSGLRVDETGTQVVDGATALAYVRSRSTQQLSGGEWQSVDGGDIQRTARQREVLAGIVDGLTTPSVVIRSPLVVSAVASSMRVDQDTHVWDLALLGLRFKTASGIESMVLPVTGSTEGGVSYVVRTSEAEAAVAAFVAGDPLPVEADG